MPLQRAPRQIFEAWHFTALLIYSRRRRGLEAPATRDLRQGRILQQPLHWTLSTSNQFTRYRPTSTPPPSVRFYPPLVTLVAQRAELEFAGACQSRYPPPLLFSPHKRRLTLAKLSFPPNPTAVTALSPNACAFTLMEMPCLFLSHPNCHHSTPSRSVLSPFHASVHRSAAATSHHIVASKECDRHSSSIYILHSSNTSR